MATRAELRKMIEEATVDAYDDEEQRIGLLEMLHDHLAFPFDTEVLGVAVTVTSLDQTRSGVVAVCERGHHRQRLPLEELPLPVPPPEGSDAIAAYRLWRGE